jgi:uncharacterized protein (DUF779 family)
MKDNLITRIVATDSAVALLVTLREKFGPLLFFLPGGGNDGSALWCYEFGEFYAGSTEVYLGNLMGTPLYVEQGQFEYWKQVQLIIDAVNGTGATDSLDSGTGQRFLTRTRLLSEEENEWLK